MDSLVRSNIEKLNRMVNGELPNLMKYKEKIIYTYDNNYVDFDEENNIYYVSKRQSINLVKKFLADVDFAYYQLFKDQKILMMNNEEIEKKQEDLFDLEIEDEALDDKIEEFCEVLKEVDLMGSHVMPVNDIHKINILAKNNIADVFSLVHEFTHIASNSVSNRNGSIYNEIQPILSEMVLRDYLVDMGADGNFIDSVNDWREHYTCSNECYVILRVLEALNKGEEISSSNLRIDEVLFDGVMEELKEEDAVDRYMEMLEVEELSCLSSIGYYYAKLLYLAIPKEMRLSMLRELNELRKNSSDVEYIKYIENIIGDTKRLNVKDIEETIRDITPNLLKYKEILYEAFDSKRDIEYNEPYYVSKRQSLTLAREFLYKIGYDYLSLFNKQDILMFTEDEADNYYRKLVDDDKEDSSLFDRLDKLLAEGRNYIVLDTGLINILAENNINDGSGLVHEFMHLISNSMSSDNEEDLFEEIQPIFGELVFLDFLLDKGMHRMDSNLLLEFLEKDHYNLADEYYALKFIDLYNSGKEIDFDNYDDKFREVAEDIENGYKLRLCVNDYNLSHTLGYYYATKLYNAIPKEMRLSTLRELNDIKSVSSNEEYMSAVEDIISNTKDKGRKVKVRKIND